MADAPTPSPAAPETQASAPVGGAAQAPPPVQGGGDGAVGEAGLGGEMSFLDHLEELRWTIFKALGGVLAAIVLCAIFSEWILNVILLGPTKPDFFMYEALGIEARELTLLNRTITGEFFAFIGAIAVAGIVVGAPVFIYFLWMFIEPALYPHEKEGLHFAAAFATFFFMLGVAFGYLILTPLALQFFANFQISEQILNQWDITRYFSMVTYWALGTGLLFELPVAIYFLTKLGITTPAALKTYRKYALLAILVLAAFFTPPDPVSQILVAVPLLLLYEFSIFVAAYSERRRRKALAKLEREGGA